MSKFAKLIHTTAKEERPAVIALHCSGASGSQWRQLDSDLGYRFALVAPDLIGSGETSRWSGDRAFTLSDEAAVVVKIIDAQKGPVHLVGHSYGSCVALRCAIERPTQVASMTLYEPAAFHVLKTMGPDGRIALADILKVAGDVGRCVLNGASHAAAKRFVEYWNGEGSWVGIRRETQDGLVRYIPKACLEFSAAISERTPLVAYGRLNCPVLLLQGEYSPEPTRMIARQLAKAMKLASLQTVYGVGHMGPMSHAATLSAMMANHIISAESRLSRDERDFGRNIDRAA
jgi:pimeloyl-ACP methyl ester carboxylesterase